MLSWEEDTRSHLLAEARIWSIVIVCGVPISEIVGPFDRRDLMGSRFACILPSIIQP